MKFLFPASLENIGLWPPWGMSCRGCPIRRGSWPVCSPRAEPRFSSPWPLPYWWPHIGWLSLVAVLARPLQSSEFLSLRHSLSFKCQSLQGGTVDPIPQMRKLN